MEPFETSIGHHVLGQTPDDTVMIIEDKYDPQPAQTAYRFDSSNKTPAWSRLNQQPTQAATNVTGSSLDYHQHSDIIPPTVISRSEIVQQPRQTAATVTSSSLDYHQRSDIIPPAVISRSEFVQQPRQTTATVTGSSLDYRQPSDVTVSSLDYHQPSNIIPSTISAMSGFVQQPTQTATNVTGSSLGYPQGGPATSVDTDVGPHKIQSCKFWESMKCVYCQRQYFNSFECSVCDIIMCRECIPTHTKGPLTKGPVKGYLRHKIEKMGLHTSATGKISQKTKSCVHCSGKEGGKRRRSTLECVICHVGVCVNCRDVHWSM